MSDVTRHRALQKLAAVFCVVMNPRHDIGTAEPLRIFKRSVGNDFTGFQIQKPDHNRGGAQVHRESMNWAVVAINLLTLQKNSVAVTSYGRIELKLFLSSWQLER